MIPPQSWAQSPLKRLSPLKRYTTDQRLFFHQKTDLNGSTINIEENNAFSA
jgi:hypothetical protein